jgi:DNA-binding response OmpR family regulator
MRLLLIEDNQRLAELIEAGMLAQGFAVDRCATIAGAHSALASSTFDLILLDLGLPDGDGIDLLRAIRRRASDTPVLVITARDALGERVLGLDSGADDYLVKPFEIAELAARCRALLRRPGHCLGTILEAGNVALDTSHRQVHVANRAIEMPPREIALLELLIRHFGRVVTRASIDTSLYAFDDEVSPNAVEAAVSRLRRRLAAASADVEIHTAHGIGYLLAAVSPLQAVNDAS